MVTKALALALFPAFTLSASLPPNIRPHHVVVPGEDIVNTLFDSASNPPIGNYPNSLNISMSTYVEDLKRLDISLHNSNITCSLHLNCHDLSHETAGPNRDVGWATYYLPCLGDMPIQVHHGEFCQMKDNRVWQMDNLWIRFEDQFFNVASPDCKEKIVHEYRREPAACRHVRQKEPNPNHYYSKHHRRTCEVGTHLTEEDVKAVMDFPPPEHGMQQGKNYCAGSD